MTFFSNCDQIRSFLRIWSYLLMKSLMKNFIFCAEGSQRALRNLTVLHKNKNRYVTLNAFIRVSGLQLMEMTLEFCTKRNFGAL